MPKYIRDDNNNKNKSFRESDILIMKKEVLNKVTIPVYFYNIILPQLQDYYSLYPVNFDIKPVACCPLHDEDTPSFRYYDDTSSFFCFGCRRGGNVINLHIYFVEKINGVQPSKEDAIYFLYNFFIKGKITESYIDDANTKIEKDVRLNTDADIVKFNIYRVNLENSITFDKTIDKKVKLKLFRELDTIDMLLSKNLINANSAEKYIKNKVRELITI